MRQTDEVAGGLAGFRRSFHQCLSPWGDVLFELCDAALCSPLPVGSVPSLSLEPVFRRSHGSLYRALSDGDVDDDRLRQALVKHRPVAWPLVFAVDASTWDRCDAECSPERGFHYSASKHSAGQPIVAGWSYQWICQLDWAPDSWTAPLDAMRVAPSMDVTIAQVDRLVDRLPNDGDIPLFVFDAGYDGIALGAGLAQRRAQILVRIASTRVFDPDPPPRAAATMGRPPRHGTRFVLSDEATWTTPDATLTVRVLELPSDRGGFGLRGVPRLGVEFLVRNGGAPAAVTVTPGSVVTVQPADELLPRTGLGGEHDPVDQLGFERREKTLRGGVMFLVTI